MWSTFYKPILAIFLRDLNLLTLQGLPGKMHPALRNRVAIRFPVFMSTFHTKILLEHPEQDIY